jgi:hypothetical protein
MQETDNKAPEDKGSFVLIFCFLNGCGVLLPWNAILASLDFFEYRMNDYNPQFVFPFAVNFLQLIMMFFVSILGANLSYNFKIGVMYLLTSVLTIILPLFAEFFHTHESVAFSLCIVTLLCFGVCVAFLQASGFGFTGVLPFKYMGVFMVGQGVSGVGMNVFRAISLAIFPPRTIKTDPTDPHEIEFKGAISSFVIASVFLVIVAFMQFAISKNEFANYYLEQSKKGNQSEQDTTALLDTSSTPDVNQENSQLSGNHVDINRQVFEAKNRDEIRKKGSVGEMLQQLKESFKLAKIAFMTEWLVFFETFICFPGLSFDMDVEFIAGPWMPLFMIITFNTMDTIGRQTGGAAFARKISPKGVFSLALLRAIFIPIFFLFAFHTPPSWLFGKNADWLKMICFLIFSFLNGFISTCAAILAPSMVTPELQAQSGTYVGIFIMTGIVSGSAVSNLIPVILGKK